MIRGVMFDLGGVVLDSPFPAIRRYETEQGLDPGVINRVVAGTGSRGAWARHERGEISFDEFCLQFTDECRAGGALINAADLLARIVAAIVPIPEMIDCVDRVRSAGFVVAAVTNGWTRLPPDGPAGRFDVVVESCVVGVRKPDPEIYALTLDLMDLAPAQVVFLDDIGMNLKPAREMGMTTIKAESPLQARRDLGAVLGMDC
jgi:epoxide hydrolase-like predicted phosphatase